MNKDVERILLTEDELKKRVKELGRQICEDFNGEPILAICVLKGSVVFFADLIREMPNDVELAFLSASSYGSGSVSSGEVTVKSKDNIDAEGKNVLLVEDILDSGRTVLRLKKAFENSKAAKIKIITLLDKPDRRAVDVDVDYAGFIIPDEFVIGYGLDYDQKYRNLPYVGILKREIYENTEDKQ